MPKRYTVLLRIENRHYKFFSIFFGGDSSFYVYSHLLDESSPLLVGETLPLLKSKGSVSFNYQNATLSDGGNQTHISIHPKGNRLYLKKRAEGDTQQHLLEEAELQPFNKNNFRLHLIQTPAPPSHLPEHDGTSVRRDEELLVFGWESEYCPQVSLYELAADFDVAQIDTLLPPALDYKLIGSDGVHSAIVLQLKATQGQPGVWRPNTGIFARVIRRGAITPSKLQDIIKRNGLNYDVSSLPDDAVITDYKIVDSDSDNPGLVVTH